jgi:two-component system, OmpR family, alkaline phosphatase synthesis response regulator PhoP
MPETENLAKMNTTILIVENEMRLAMTLKRRLQREEEYVVSVARDGNSGLEMAMQGRFDLLILDMMLPGQRGLEVCKKLRQHGSITPILMLTTRRRTLDKVIGLRTGADDCLSKPFKTIELMARVDALLRRAKKSQPDHLRYDYGELDIDGYLNQVTFGRHNALLSPLESRLLRYFLEHRRVTLSRDELARQVWGYQSPLLTRTVDVHVAWLRRKIEEDPRNPQHIVTVNGFGYKFIG